MLAPYQMNLGVMEMMGNTPFLEWAQRRFPEYAKYFFLYRHKVTKNYVFAGHTLRPGWIVDFHIFGQKYNPTMEDRKVIEHILDPAPGQEFNADMLARNMRSQQRSADEAHAAEVRELADMGKFMAKRGSKTAQYLGYGD